MIIERKKKDPLKKEKIETLRRLRVLGIKVLIKVTRCQGVEVRRSRSQIRGCVRSNLKNVNHLIAL